MGMATVAMTNMQGYQDTFINPKPSTNIFKHAYRQFYNFTIHTQCVTGNVSAVQSSSIQQQFKLHRAGHMLTKVYHHTVLPAQTTMFTDLGTGDHFYFVNAVGYAMIEKITLRLGQQDVESQSGRFMEMWEELASPPGKRLAEIIARHSTEAGLIQQAKHVQVLMTPVSIWCFTKYADALPLLALQGTDVELWINYKPIADWTVIRGNDSPTGAVLTSRNAIPGIILSDLLCQYVYLDRVMAAFYASPNKTLYNLARVTQEQQFTTIAGDGTTYTRHGPTQVTMNHPTKMVIWALQHPKACDGLTYTNGGVGLKDQFDYSNPSGGESMTRADFTLNSASIWESDVLPAMYYRSIQSLESCERISSRNVYMHNFGPNSTHAQVYGTFNMSRVDNKHFAFHHNLDSAAQGWLWGVSINIMTICGGAAVFPFAA